MEQSMITEEKLLSIVGKLFVQNQLMAERLVALERKAEVAATGAPPAT